MKKQDVAIKIANHLAAITYEDLPKDIVDIAKKSILDTIGVMVGASGVAKSCQKVVAMIREDGGKRESSILGFGDKVPAMMAAFANGSMTKTLDYDDVVGEAFVHPTAVTLPAALAIAEKAGKVSGKEFITAMVLGMDLIIRLGLSVTKSSRGFKYDWHPTPLFGTFSSTAAAGKLLQLDAEAMSDALGIAFLQAAGSLQMVYSEGADIGVLANAFPGKAGVISAMMAKRGITGIKDCFESKAGFFNNYFQGGYDPSYLIEGLGKEYTLSMIGYKPWPTCRRAHTYIDAALQLVHTYHIDAADVAAVKIFYGDDFSKSLCEPLEQRRRPQTSFFANTSLPFAVAVAIAKKRAIVADFQPEFLQEQLVLEVANKVIPEYDVKLDENLSGGIPAGRVDILMREGQTYSTRVDVPYGHYNNPVTTEALIEKFRDCVSYSIKPISQSSIDKGIDLILNLEKLKDIQEMIRCFV
ncbi:MAG: MmgE/PrpD family protein [Veillonellales bacterium]